MLDIDRIRALLNGTAAQGYDFYERRTGAFQLIIPILHEDGDMVDIYLQDSPLGEDHVRICDFGMTLMRLSYTYDIATDARRRIFDSILINNGVGNDDGNLYLDAAVNRLNEGILQFAGCAQKVCNMRYWSRETVRSEFYENLGKYVTGELGEFDPVPDLSPLVDYPISVDWSLAHRNRQFYLFGVRGNEKAKNVAIALLEFEKAQLPFISLVVHEDIEELGRKERTYLTRNADTQYPQLDDFRERSVSDIYRLAGVARCACLTDSHLRYCREPTGLVLQSQIIQAPFVVAFLGSGLVAPSPPRPVQDEIRRLVLCPYKAGRQPAHLRDRHWNQLFIRAVAAPFSPCSIA